MTSLINMRRIAAVCTFAVFAFFAVAVSSAYAAPNLIQNPSVEASTTVATLPDNWAQGGFGVSSTTFSYAGVEGHTGKGVSITITNYSSGDAKWIFEPVLIEGGALYTFSNWYKSTAPTRLVVAYTGGVDADHPNRFIEIASLPASADWTQATASFPAFSGYASATVYHVLEANGTLTTDDYSLELTAPASATIFDKGIVSLTFDDGWDTQRTNAFPELTAAGFKATFYLVGKVLHTLTQTPNSGYFGTTTLLELQNAGHEIGNHTENHCNLVRLNAGENSNTSDACAFPAPNRTYQNEIDEGDASVRNAGATAINTIGYPNGATNATIKSYIQSNPSIIGARTITEGYNTKQADRLALKVQVVSRAISLETIKSWIDTAVANKFWLILVFHQVDTEANLISTGAEGGTTPEKFAGALDHLESKGSNVEVLTVRDALARMGVTPPPTDTTAPVIAPHADVFATTSATSGTAVAYTSPTATDNVDGAVAVSCSPASGSVFAIGSTTVTCTTKDAANNHATSTFAVGVSLAATSTTPEPTPTPTPTPAPTPAPSSGGGSGSGGGGGIVGGGPLSIGFVNTNPTGSVLGAQTSNPTSSCYQFLVTLQGGSTGADVSALQARLMQDGLFSAGITGYFGPVTRAAVVAFQQKHGISAVGIVGPKTRAVLNAGCPSAQVTTPSTPGTVLGTSAFTFTKTLSVGSTGTEVSELQKVLIALSFLKIAAPTGFFGSLTKAAVADYQMSRGIEAVGIVGPKTRAALNSNAQAVK